MCKRGELRTSQVVQKTNKAHRNFSHIRAMKRISLLAAMKASASRRFGSKGWGESSSPSPFSHGFGLAERLAELGKRKASLFTFLR